MHTEISPVEKTQIGPSTLPTTWTRIMVNALAPVGAVASEGALALNGWNDEDHLEPVEAMAEAALQLCWRPATECSGEIARSVPLLRRLGVAIRQLDGQTLLQSEEARI